MCHFLLLSCISFTLLDTFVFHAAVQKEPSKASEDAAPKPSDFVMLAEIFLPPGTPNIKGKRWVAADTGPDNFRHALQGWIFEDGPKEIVLLDLYGTRHNLRKPKAAEGRPKIREEKDGSFLWSEWQNADYSVAWQVQHEDFDAVSKKFLKDGIPSDKEGNDIYAGVRQRFGLADHVVDAARFAHLANLLGQREHAAQLYLQAIRAYEKYASTYMWGEPRAPLYQFVADRIASSQRTGAIFSGHGTTARDELKKQWEHIAVIPHHKYRDEAKAMAKHYQSLIDEDRRWVEPDAKALAKMAAEQKTAYWLYHLRDLKVGQWSDPGMCSVFGGFGLDLGGNEKNPPNAAVELDKLGIAAVPLLIAHLDDARPTRCKGHWRRYWPEGHYLLRYGDCCQQIFQSISGRSIYPRKSTTGYPIQDGLGKECKANAERWWAEYQKKSER